MGNWIGAGHFLDVHRAQETIEILRRPVEQALARTAEMPKHQMRILDAGTPELELFRAACTCSWNTGAVKCFDIETARGHWRRHATQKLALGDTVEDS